jgi:hypothetical protein
MTFLICTSKQKVSYQQSFVDLIGVITYVGPHDFASPTSHIKLRKLKIVDIE